MFDSKTATPTTDEDLHIREMAKAAHVDNPFANLTREGTRKGYKPRPTRDDPAYRALGEAGVRDLQAQWDAVENWMQYQDKVKATRLAEQEAEREAERQQLASEQEASFVDGLRQKYFAADPSVTEAEFLEDLPKIRRQHRIAAALSGQPTNDNEARRLQAIQTGIAR
jgi:hypothetical protein